MALAGARNRVAQAQAPDKVTRSACFRDQFCRCRIYVALDLGYFKEVNIEPEMTKLMGGPANVAAQ